jgi:hypothetical protein
LNQLVANKELRSVKWVFLSLVMGVTALGFFGLGRPASEPTVEIEGRNVPYQFVHVFSDGSGRDVVAEFHDVDSKIDFSSRIPRSVGREIVAWQSENKTGCNYEETHLAARRHRTTRKD